MRYRDLRLLGSRVDHFTAAICSITFDHPPVSEVIFIITTSRTWYGTLQVTSYDIHRSFLGHEVLIRVVDGKERCCSSLSRSRAYLAVIHEDIPAKNYEDDHADVSGKRHTNLNQQASQLKSHRGIRKKTSCHSF